VSYQTKSLLQSYPGAASFLQGKRVRKVTSGLGSRRIWENW